MTFLFLDIMVFGTSAWKNWTANSVDIAEFAVTFTFGCDICLALAALRRLNCVPLTDAEYQQTDAVWWAGHHKVIKANLVSNVCSLAALAFSRLIKADGLVPLMCAVAYVLLRASKLRPLVQLHRQVSLVHDDPDEDHSFDDLLSHWAVKRDVKTQKLVTVAIWISLAVVIVTLGMAAFLDAMSGVGLLSINRPSANTAHNIPLSPTSLDAMPGYTSDINGDETSYPPPAPTLLSTWCDCQSYLGDASAGTAVGGAGGALGGAALGPEAIPVGTAIGGAIGGFFGAVCHLGTC